MSALTTASNAFCKPFNSPRGFTLLEVMISVAIIALIFVSLFRMQSGTIELAAAGKFNSIAPILANQVLVKIEQDITGWSESQGDFGDDVPGFQWKADVLDVSLEALEFISTESRDRLKKIEIEITGSSGEQTYKMTTWRFAGE